MTRIGEGQFQPIPSILLSSLMIVRLVEGERRGRCGSISAVRGSFN